MNKTALRVLLLTGSLLGAFLVAEVGYRLVRDEAGETYQMYFQDGERRSYWPDRASQEEKVAFHSGIQQWVEHPMPRPNTPTWRPGAHFYICYTGPRQPYFDEQGCVEYRFNSLGLRDREDLSLEKPAGTYRILCLGDSFTLGWGVRREHNWPVLVEGELRVSRPRVQVVNCGGAGTSYADEYAAGLVHRFGRFEPDLVLVTLCLNDLLITNGKLGHYRKDALPDENRPDGEAGWLGSAILADLWRGLRARSALALDPDRNHVRELLDLPADHPYYARKNESPDLYWGAGTPQRALRDMHHWCRERDVRFAVCVWPLFQGLDEGAFYPFEPMHQMVREFCRSEGIACLDLLPAFRGHPAEELWVSPVDMHPNECAQAIASPVIARFLAEVAGFER